MQFHQVTLLNTKSHCKLLWDSVASRSSVQIGGYRPTLCDAGQIYSTPLYYYSIWGLFQMFLTTNSDTISSQL